jgi:hypothetical protein
MPGIHGFCSFYPFGGTRPWFRLMAFAALFVGMAG